jgi:hypothetical protein
MSAVKDVRHIFLTRGRHAIRIYELNSKLVQYNE